MPKSVSAQLPDGSSLVCGPCTFDDFSRYLQKLRMGSRGAAYRELILNTCTSHETAEEIMAVLNRYPAVTRKLATAVDELSQASSAHNDAAEHCTVITFADGTELRFAGPDCDQWENFQDSLADQRMKAVDAHMGLLKATQEQGEAELNAALVKAPAFVTQATALLAELAGFTVKVEEKKGEDSSVAPEKTAP